MGPGLLTPVDLPPVTMALATTALATPPATPPPRASIPQAPEDPRELQDTMVHLEVVLVTAPRPIVITIPLVTDKRLLTWKPRGLTGSRCTMRQASSQLFHSHQTTQEDGKHPRETTTRATPPHPALHSVPPRPAAWDPRRMTLLPWAPHMQAGAPADSPLPRPLTLRYLDHRPRWRTSRGSTRSTTTPTGRPGWTSCSTSWRSAAPRSPSAPPFPKTHSIFTSCTCTPRIGEAFSSAPTRKPGKILLHNSG